jgi:hypothetical protein
MYSFRRTMLFQKTRPVTIIDNDPSCDSTNATLKEALMVETNSSVSWGIVCNLNKK